jgi:WD40 repeat protein
MSIVAQLKHFLFHFDRPDEQERLYYEKEYHGGPVVFVNENEFTYHDSKSLCVYNVAKKQGRVLNISASFLAEAAAVSCLGVYAIVGHKGKVLSLSNGVVYKPKRAISCICFSPDGAVLAIGTANNTIHLLNVVTGKAQILTNGYHEKVLAIKFENNTIVSVCEAGMIRTLQNKKCISKKQIPFRDYHDRPCNIDEAAFSPKNNGLLAVSNREFNVLHVYDHTTRRILHSTYRARMESAYKFFPDGKHLLLNVCKGSGHLEIRNVANGSDDDNDNDSCVIKIHTTENRNVTEKLSVSPKGTLIAVHNYVEMTAWSVFDRVQTCAIAMLLLNIDIPIYVVRDIINMLHATMGGMSASFDSIGKFFGPEKFKLIAQVQEAKRLQQLNRNVD